MEKLNKQGVEGNFVPFELAVKLKELGFNERCLAYYSGSDGQDKTLYTYHISFSINSTTTQYHSNISDKNYTFSAPIWQQAFDWFREKYSLVGEPIPYYGDSERPMGWQWQVWNTKSGEIEKSQGMTFCSEYNVAKNFCLEKLIEIVEKQQA